MHKAQTPNKIKVLYIHHFGSFGGASRSLLELINAFPENAVEPVAIVARGNVVPYFQKLCLDVVTVKGLSLFDNTKLSYYRGKRWVILLREILLIPSTFISIRKAKKKWPDIDLIHVNEIPILLSVFFAKKIIKKPVVVHSRSPQRNDSKSVRVKFVAHVLNKYANAVIAIDKTVFHSLPKLLIPTFTVHNGFTASSAISTMTDNLNAYFTKKGDRMQAGMIGNFYIMKGIYEFFEAARICKERGLEIDFFVVGENPRSAKGIMGRLLKKLNYAPDIKTDLLRLTNKNNMDDCFHVFGFTSNIKLVLDFMDLNVFPSHINAVGRPVFEAAFSKIPSIVAIKDPYDDTIIDGQTGICIKEKDAVSLADAIEYFYNHPVERKQMGQNAYDLAVKNFDIVSNASKVLDIYKMVVQ